MAFSKIIPTLDWFVDDALHAAGVWQNQSTDGLQASRVVDLGEDRARVIARMWEIASQELITFWLDLEREPDGGFAWTLHFGMVGATARQERNSVDLLARPEDARWAVVLSGRAALSDDGLRVEDRRGVVRIV